MCIVLVSIGFFIFRDRLFSPVSFNYPIEFRCNQSVDWHDLHAWRPIKKDEDFCSASAEQYSVRAETGLFNRSHYTHVGVQAISRVDNHETFVPASDGRLVETARDEFDISLCLSKEQTSSTLLFTFFDEKKVCDTCIINIVSSEKRQAPKQITTNRKTESIITPPQIVKNHPGQVSNHKNSSKILTEHIEFCRNCDGTIEGTLEEWINSYDTITPDLFCVTVKSTDGGYSKCYLTYDDCNSHRENPIDCIATPVATFTQTSYKFYKDPPMICYSIPQ